MRRGIIVGIIIVVVLLGVLGTVGYLTYQRITDLNDQIEMLEAENMELQAEIDNQGELKSIYIASGTIEAGEVFDSSKVSTVTIPGELITNAYVTDLAQLENMLYKVDVEQDTPLVYDLFMEEPVQSTDRYIDVVLNDYPVGAKTGEYYDIRFRTQSGLDYIVLSKKRVARHDASSLRMILNEEELLIYNSALFDEVFGEGGMLYATVYVEPSAQKGAQIFYAPSSDIIGLMESDPNLVPLAYATVRENRAMFEEHQGLHTAAEYAKASQIFNDIIAAHNASSAALAKSQSKSSGSGDGSVSEGEGTGTGGGLSVGIAQGTGTDSGGGGGGSAMSNIIDGGDILG